MRPFRFGVLHMSPITDGAAWLDSVRAVEAAGYSTMLLSDHFERSPLAPILALAAAGSATSTPRLGSLVLANDFRHPAVLAKELTTIDIFSGGRLEVGLGARWMVDDYDQAGIDLQSAGPRIDRLEEALTILTASLEGEVAEGLGPRYPVSAMPPVPRAVQQPRPPILIGGGGQRILRLAATRADIVSINWKLTDGRFNTTAIRSGDATHTEEQVNWVREAAGDRFDQLDLHLQIYLAALTHTPQKVAEHWCEQLGFVIDVGELLDSPHVLVGSFDDLEAKIQRLRERWGFSYLSFYDTAAQEMGPLVRHMAEAST